MTREEAQAAWERIVDVGFLDYDKLSHDEKVWFNIEPLTTDGVIDHYVNTAAEHNQDTLKALEFLGFPDIAEQMRRLNNLFAHGQPPVDIMERNQEWDAWCDKHEVVIDEVDRYFWARCDDVEKALLEHINSSGIAAI